MTTDEKGLKRSAFKRLKYKKKYRKGPAPRDGWDVPPSQDPHTPEEILGDELPVNLFNKSFNIMITMMDFGINTFIRRKNFIVKLRSSIIDHISSIDYNLIIY